MGAFSLVTQGRLANLGQQGLSPGMGFHFH